MAELAKNVDWVGYVDWNVRDFHSYDTPRGATYNAYLIRDEKNALIDTVKGHFVDRLLKNVSEKVELEKLDYVICNHAEPDHSSGIPEVLKAAPNAKLLCNSKCREVLAEYYDTSGWNFEIVDPDSTISLGNRTLKFINTPMVHWPESMFTYLPEEGILFSMDAFGQHLSTSVRFDDEWPLEEIMTEAKWYYANIVNPYGRQVLKTLEAAASLDLRMLATSHGLIWRKHIPEIISAYKDWANGKFAKKVVIIYDTMWESTLKMAEAIAQGAISVSDTLDVQTLHIRKVPISRIALEMLDAPAVAFGSATLNTQVMPMVGAMMSYLKGLKFREKTCFAFGSSGWGVGGPELIQKWFEEVKWNPIAPPLRSKNQPTPEILDACFKAGVELGKCAKSEG